MDVNFRTLDLNLLRVERRAARRHFRGIDGDDGAAAVPDAADARLLHALTAAPASP